MAALNRTDWLTGMPSMTHFHDLARAGVRKLFAKGSRPVAVSLDIMGMKDFNARYGRSEGNRLLFDLATLLRTCFGNDACSRFAEDHFNAYAAENEVEEKLKAVFRGFSKADFAHVPPVRAGVYALHRSDDIVATGFDYAKLACDLDRNTWQSHITWFTGKMREAARRRMHVLESLDQAIASGWIRPHYQAIVRAATGEICNEEALARWMDPEFGKLYPDQFIPDLEEAGLLYKLDLHIVDCVVRDLCLRKKHGMPLVPISMNFSLRDLTKLARRADEAGIPRGLLRVELTESVASSDQAFMRKQLDELHAAGFEVWMDDFGSGYSSLNTLQEFDFDLIKLDMGFLRSNDVEKSHIIMAGVVEAANRMGVATLAEGVESEDQAVFLESIGCDMLQGFHYAKPRALDEILNHFAHYDDVRFERFDEKGYWNAISLLTVSDFITQQGNLKPEDVQQPDHNPMQEVPRGVVECRDGTWSMLRGNRAFKELLVEKGYLASIEAAMQATPLTRPLADRTVAAAQKSVVSGEWEHVVGQLEQSMSHQLFIRHVKSTPDAQAFMCAAVPTMLGSALGAYGDVPLAYAVFRTIMNEDGTKVVDTEYVYANNLYHAWSGFEPGELAGYIGPNGAGKST
ncbi:MAG: EAL domain-containing protein, partial [Coriobacteriales bacterium]|nr:EAL domain-containing protein [Coriobacteriales bacterium]